MFCDESKYSVSLEVSNQGKWLMLNTAAMAMTYYFTVHDRDESVVWAGMLFVGITSALVFWGFHRMKVARVKLNIDEGESEWTSAVCMYVIALLLFYTFNQIVDKSVHDSIRDYAFVKAGTEEDLHKASRVFQSHSSPNDLSHYAKGSMEYKEEQKYISDNIPVYCYILFAGTIFFNFMTYVKTSRFGNIADDRFYSGNV